MMFNRSVRTILACAVVLTFGGALFGAIGADVVYTGLNNGVTSYGPVGSLVAYSYGSYTCNMSPTVNLAWVNGGSPGLAMNLYRLHDGRIEQIGQSFVKHACCAAASNNCGLVCNGQSGSVLGAGCRDPYTSSYNGGWGRLGPRSGINAYTGSFTAVPGGSGDAVWRRLQVQTSDLISTNFPGALYFAEGVYVATDDAAGGMAMNNASYTRVTVGAASPYPLTVVGSMGTTKPAIMAWREHGLGPNLPDNSVTLGVIDVTSEGRFHYAYKVVDLGGGQWRYTYAVFNLNSDRSGGSLNIPVPAGVSVTNVGFKGVVYHSGEPYDNTDWGAVVDSAGVTWSSPQTYAQNINSNALRWGTMYTFWFTANTAPTQGGGTLGLFKPHTPQSMPFSASVPSAPIACTLFGDVNVDTRIDGIDVNSFVACMLNGTAPGGNCDCADMDDNGKIDDADLGLFVEILTGP